MKRPLGTQLRHLIELLDGAVSAAYEEDGPFTFAAPSAPATAS